MSCFHIISTSKLSISSFFFEIFFSIGTATSIMKVVILNLLTRVISCLLFVMVFSLCILIHDIVWSGGSLRSFLGWSYDIRCRFREIKLQSNNLVYSFSSNVVTFCLRCSHHHLVSSNYVINSFFSFSVRAFVHFGGYNLTLKG